jgi:hypothetical protein
MFRRTVQLILAACLLTATAWAADDPFTGKWRLDPAQTQLPPDTMKVQSAGGNKYTFIFVEPNSETIAVDGTDQPGIFHTTLSVTVQGPRVWKVVRKNDGHTLLTGIWTLSDDGATLHDDYTEYRTSDSTFSVDYLYKRTAGDSGFPGTWQSTSATVKSPYEIQIQPYATGGLSIVDPVEGATKSVKFDGQDYPGAGPNADPDTVFSGRRVSGQLLELTDKYKGKVRDTEDFQLSPDLKTLTVTRRSSPQDPPTILVFDRE